MTLRARRDVPYLRADRPFRIVRGAIHAASRDGFRVIHFSVQGDHLHLIVEADDADELSSGARGLSIRIAKRLNHRLGRRGAVWADRWNGHALRAPREVRNAIVYVLANHKKHVRDTGAGVDRLSSAPWFEGWANLPTRVAAALRARAGPICPVRCPHTWLARVGWRRHGLVRIAEAPRRGPSRASMNGS